jgi:hypothetical protein
MTSRKKKIGIILLAIACAAAAGSGASTFQKNKTGTGTFNYNTSGTVTVPNQTGNVLISGNASIVAADVSGSAALTNAQQATMANNTVKGNVSGGAATPSDLSATQVTALLNSFVGDSGAGGTKGAVPAPAAGDAAAGKFLKSDGTWTVPAGAGDVTGPASSVDSEVALFSGVGGKTLKRATSSGIAVLTSGVQTAGPLTGDVTTSGSGLATTAAATQANIVTLSKSTGVAVHGTNTNDNAAAGYVGEYVESVVTSTNFSTSSNWADLTSISLTAGDWEVTWAICGQAGGTITNNDFNAGVSTTSGNSATGLVTGSSSMDFPFNTVSSSPCQGGSIAGVRFSLSGTTTIYGKYRAIYTGGPPTAAGRLSARRLR